MDTVNTFISAFCQWAQDGHLPRKSQSKLPHALRKAIDVKLVNDDNRREIIVRQLVGSNILSCEYNSQELWLKKSLQGWLETGAIGPGWRRGWGNFHKDKQIEDLISGFFHFAGQYVHRGRYASVVGAIATTYKIALDFRSGSLKSKYLHMSDSQMTITEESLFINDEIRIKKSSSRERELVTWIRCINGLDPYINRAVFQYWRAIDLLSSEYYEEAITALDGLTSVATLFLQERLSLPNQTRNNLGSYFDLTEEDENNLKYLYKLRCAFGAHPSQSKWWDFGEIYGEDFDDLFETSKRLLWNLCKAENHHREIDPHPSTWSDWFRENALMLFHSVWFKNII